VKSASPLNPISPAAMRTSGSVKALALILVCVVIFMGVRGDEGYRAVTVGEAASIRRALNLASALASNLLFTDQRKLFAVFYCFEPPGFFLCPFFSINFLFVHRHLLRRGRGVAT
jgi:hypothetical protein